MTISIDKLHTYYSHDIELDIILNMKLHERQIYLKNINNPKQFNFECQEQYIVLWQEPFFSVYSVLYTSVTKFEHKTCVHCSVWGSNAALEVP